MKSEQTAPLTKKHLDGVASHYDKASPGSKWAGQAYRRLLAHYYRHLVPEGASVLEVGCGSGDLLALLPNRDVTGIDLSAEQIRQAKKRVPYGTFHQAAGESLRLDRTFDYVVLADTLNQAADVQAIFEALQGVAEPHTRIVVNCYNALWRPLLSAATAAGLRERHTRSNWLSPTDVENLLELGGWEAIKRQARILCPVPILGIDRLVNRWIAPLLPWFCLTMFHVARPRRPSSRRDHIVSVVVPARNEAGNIEAAVQRTAEMGGGTELIFIEGNSTDDTWDEINRIAAAYPDRRIVTMRQTGKGKGNAVREAFAAATGDILMILDADLTMPPEELPKFYEVIASGRGEFANGVRLVYPMEGQAMQFLNMCANKIFGVAFTWLLGQPLKDTLCGTKVLYRNDYDRIAANRSFFGDFDPFGDFDLLFGADKLNLKIVDVPIRYRDRTYGSTNIDRWRHGALLIRMVAFAARKLKFI